MVVVRNTNAAPPLLLHHHSTVRLHRRETVIVEQHRADVPRRQFEQIFFNPVVEPRGELGGIDLHAIHRVLASLPHETQNPRSASSTGRLPIFLADHEPRQRRPGLVTDLDELSYTGHTRLDLLRIRLDHSEGLMIGRRRADDVERLHVDQLRGGSGQVLAGIGRIVIVRGQDPHTTRLDHLER